jgi:hypothetical protein
MTINTATLIDLGSPLQRWMQRWAGAMGSRAAVAPRRSAVEEAAAVRALADTYRDSDPGFASDLYAAADRHEAAAEAAEAAAGR